MERSGNRERDIGGRGIPPWRRRLGGERAATLDDRLSWRSILTALCYVGPFWVLVGLSICHYRSQGV
jgi:hypothetical protein